MYDCHWHGFVRAAIAIQGLARLLQHLFYLIARETRRANNGTTSSVDRCNTTFGYCHSNVSSAICQSSSVVRVHSNKTAVAIVMRLLLKYIIIRNVSFLFFMKKKQQRARVGYRERRPGPQASHQQTDSN